MLRALQVSSMPAPRAQQSTTVPFQAGTVPAQTTDGINISELMNLMITMMIVMMMMKMMAGMMAGVTT